MANSRSERIGTIFSRITSLIKGNALEKENIPLWYNVYEAFPPKHEPRFDKPKPMTELRKIFYAEDLLRAQFYKRKIHTIDMTSPMPSKCQIFLEIYNDVLKNKSNNCKVEEAYNEAIKQFDMWMEIRDKKKASL